MRLVVVVVVAAAFGPMVTETGGVRLPAGTVFTPGAAVPVRTWVGAHPLFSTRGSQGYKCERFVETPLQFVETSTESVPLHPLLLSTSA
jgi:hypothetical protein